MDEFDKGAILGILLGLCLMGIIWLAVGETKTSGSYLKISQETGDEICQNLVGNETAIAKDWWDYEAGKEPIEKGGIVCELPSFDATHNIVVRTND